MRRKPRAVGCTWVERAKCVWHHFLWRIGAGAPAWLVGGLCQGPSRAATYQGQGLMRTEVLSVGMAAEGATASWARGSCRGQVRGAEPHRSSVRVGEGRLGQAEV